VARISGSRVLRPDKRSHRQKNGDQVTIHEKPQFRRQMLGLASDADPDDLRMTMDAATPNEPARHNGRKRGALLGGGLAVLAAMLFLAGCGSGDNDGATGAGQTRPLTAETLRGRASSARTPVYWVGPRQGVGYELEVRGDGSAFVRYVRTGSGGAKDASVVATYPSATAFADVRAAGRRDGSTTIRLPNGGVAAYERARPTNVFVAFPGVAAQIEVFDASPARARAIVARGGVQPVTPDSAAPVQPFAVNAQELRGVARSLRPEPVYWAGWQQGIRYELTRTDAGAVYVRYLPAGVVPGDPRAGLLTVATYPRADALADVRAAAKRDGAVSFSIPSGGVAVYDRASPSNVHLAYPGESWQIEVYGSSGTDVAALVRAGRIVRLR
jgi:hypothetical protein